MWSTYVLFHWKKVWILLIVKRPSILTQCGLWDEPVQGRGPQHRLFFRVLSLNSMGFLEPTALPTLWLTLKSQSISHDLSGPWRGGCEFPVPPEHLVHTRQGSCTRGCLATVQGRAEGKVSAVALTARCFPRITPGQVLTKERENREIIITYLKVTFLLVM